jgi:hypothetical protein
MAALDELARSCEVGLATISKALAVIFPVPGNQVQTVCLGVGKSTISRLEV